MLGSALVPHLLGRGHDVATLVRRKPANRREFAWSPGREELPSELLASFDAVINLSGANIGARPWTSGRRRVLRNSRIDTTGCLVRALAKHPGKQFLCASAVGYYGDRGDEVLTEASPKGEGFLAGLCDEWEQAALAAESFGTRVCCLRLGLVLGGGGGFLGRLHPLFAAGLGGRLGDGKAWMSWISLDDLLSTISFALTDKNLGRHVNVVSPNPVRNLDFTRLYARSIGRRAPYAVPAWLLKMALGSMGRELLLASTRAYPGQLLQHAFAFRRTELRSALYMAEEERRRLRSKT